MFNSSSKAINKVIDDQGNWVPISNTDFAYGRSVCVAAIEEMNIFVAAGALVLNNTRCESLNSWCSQAHYKLSRRAFFDCEKCIPS